MALTERLRSAQELALVRHGRSLWLAILSKLHAFASDVLFDIPDNLQPLYGIVLSLDPKQAALHVLAMRAASLALDFFYDCYKASWPASRTAKSHKHTSTSESPLK